MTLVKAPETQAPRLGTYEQAAEMLAAPVGTVRSMVSRGQIPCVRLSARVVRFDVAELAAWIETRRVPAKRTGGGL